MNFKINRYFIFFTILMASGACTQLQPWERNHHAKNSMQWGHDSHKTSLDNHIYTSKEGSSGGNAAASGGCGCG